MCVCRHGGDWALPGVCVCVGIAETGNYRCVRVFRRGGDWELPSVYVCV